ncbi:hypothetical protein TIFTF001_020698 [Ficus carica]|uniref:Uncharacterized protein n=1 Tax=Ficus carica TaxID=3494 RepID=A0AA88AE99_FICCA|nr:hypothetical protein TIFTF001_020698 [Ficus carica]
MVQTRSHTTRLPEHGVLVPYRSCEPKRKVKLSKAGEIKRRRVTVVDTYDDPTYDANSNMPINNAEPSQHKWCIFTIMYGPIQGQSSIHFTLLTCDPFENAADSKGPGQNGEREIEADPTDDGEPINGSPSINKCQVATSSVWHPEFAEGFFLFRSELLQSLSSIRHPSDMTAKKFTILEKQMGILTHLAYLMRTDMAGEKQDEVAAGEHKGAPEEVFPTKVSQSLITKKGQSSDAQKTPTEEAVDEASPLDYKQSDEARPKTSENKRVCMMRTVVKMEQGKRFSGNFLKGVWSRKVNKNLKGSPQTPKQLLTWRQGRHDVLDDNALLSPIFSNINLMDEPPSKTVSCFPENEVDNRTKFHNTELPGLENNNALHVDSSHNDHYLHVEVEDSGIRGQKGAIENMSTSSADVGVAETWSSKHLPHERVIANKKELSPEDSSTDRSYVLDLDTLEVEGGSSIRGRQGHVESSGEGNIIAKGLELAAIAEPLSSSRYHEMSSSIENDTVAENREAATPVTIDLTTEENETESTRTFCGGEFTGSEIGARIRRLQRVIGGVKRAKYSLSFLCQEETI